MVPSRFVDVEALRRAATDGLRAAFHELTEKHPDESIYGFGFYSHDAGYITTTAFTTEGLEEAVERYEAMARDPEISYMTEKPREQWRTSLRWNPADSPRHLIGGDLLETASQISLASRDQCEQAVDEVDDDTAERDFYARIETVYDTLISVLQTLDDEGVFGDQRNEIVLNLWEGDQSFEDRVAFSARCNPPEVAERFEREELASYEE